MSQNQTAEEFKTHPYKQYMQDKYDGYDEWVKAQGVPLYSGSFLEDARTAELGEWEARGARGAIFQFSDQRASDGCILELPPRGSAVARRQLYEEIVLVVEGQGSTSLWYEGYPKHAFEWRRGSVFAIPINALHQHHNGSASAEARLVSLTSAPPIIDFFRNEEFVFQNDFAFFDRFDARDQNFFAADYKYLTEYYGGILETNFISDIRKIKLVPREARGKGNKNMYIHFAGSTMFAHVSSFPVGTYKRPHRHGPGAHICMLDSTGYTLMWYDGEEPTRYDWAEGSIVSPPAGMWHQHYNTGSVPCRYVALHASNPLRSGGGEKGQQLIENSMSEMLEEMYRKECEANGVEVVQQ